MKVLVACEFSGVVRDAFALAGHDAWSCDFLESETFGNHIKGNCLDVMYHGWDIMIAHPPCNDICTSGALHFKYKRQRQADALGLVLMLLNAPVKRICIENPVGIISTYIKKPTQIIHPWQFGHGEKKTTCLWLKNLPPLVPTDIVSGREQRILKMPGGVNQKKNRSRFYPGIAKAMAEQWGSVLLD